jgi:hypothetical protein|nr:MAG TPA: Putative bacterial sensory transduction regulator [Caudoviricetes sp.]
MENEGMTDKQFKAFLRLLIGSVEDIKEEIEKGEVENVKIKVNKLANTLQRCIDM